MLRYPSDGRIFVLPSRFAESISLGKINRVAPVRFGYGLGLERFEWFRFSVLAVPLRGSFLVFQ